MPFVYKDADCPQISSYLGGGGMCLEILSLPASSVPEHLYVFVVLMNGTKVSGGRVQGGNPLFWGEQP